MIFRNLLTGFDYHNLTGLSIRWQRTNPQPITSAAFRANPRRKASTCINCSVEPYGDTDVLASTNAEPPEHAQIPWQISKYYTKKSRRVTDAAGELSQDMSNMLEPVGWNPDAKLHLAVQAVALESGMSIEAVYLQLETMMNVVPDLLAPAPGGIKIADLVRLAVYGEDVAEKLLALKGAFPEADVSRMVACCPQLLDLNLQDFTRSTQQARDMLASATRSPAAVVQAVPQLASAAALQAVVQELQRLFGRNEGEALKMLCQNAALADCCQSLAHQARGDRDLEYVKDVFGNRGA